MEQKWYRDQILGIYRIEAHRRFRASSVRVKAVLLVDVGVVMNAIGSCGRNKFVDAHGNTANSEIIISSNLR